MLFRSPSVTSTYSTAWPNTSPAFTRGRLDIAASLTDAFWDNGAGGTSGLRGGQHGTCGANDGGRNAGNPGPPGNLGDNSPARSGPTTPLPTHAPTAAGSPTTPMISTMTHATSVPAAKCPREFSSDQLSGERCEDSGITHGFIGPR